MDDLTQGRGWGRGWGSGGRCVALENDQGAQAGLSAEADWVAGLQVCLPFPALRALVFVCPLVPIWVHAKYFFKLCLKLRNMAVCPEEI